MVDVDLADWTEAELLEHSQEIKKEIEQLRNQRRVIAREIERRSTEAQVEAELAALSPAARARIQTVAPGVA